MSKFVIILFITLAIVANVFGYWIKLIVKAKGHNVTYLFVDPGDFFKLIKLIKKENDNKIKRKYWKIFWAAIISVILLIILFVGIIINMNIQVNN